MSSDEDSSSEPVEQDSNLGSKSKLLGGWRAQKSVKIRRNLKRRREKYPKWHHTCLDRRLPQTTTYLVYYHYRPNNEYKYHHQNWRPVVQVSEEECELRDLGNTGIHNLIVQGVIDCIAQKGLEEIPSGTLRLPLSLIRIATLDDKWWDNWCWTEGREASHLDLPHNLRLEFYENEKNELKQCGWDAVPSRFAMESVELKTSRVVETTFKPPAWAPKANGISKEWGDLQALHLEWPSPPSLHLFDIRKCLCEAEEECHDSFLEQWFEFLLGHVRNKQSNEDLTGLLERVDELADSKFIELADAVFNRLNRSPKLMTTCLTKLENPTTVLTRISTVADIDRTSKDQLKTLTQKMVFGSSQPSVAGLRIYLKRLHGTKNYTYVERQELAKTLNFWKSELDVDFTYKRKICTIRARRNSTESGDFQLRSLGNRQHLLGSVDFPPIGVRKRH